MTLSRTLSRLSVALALAGLMSAASCVREKPAVEPAGEALRVTPPGIDRDVAGKQRGKPFTMGALEADPAARKPLRRRPTTAPRPEPSP
jgi:hypothetical protein